MKFFFILKMYIIFVYFTFCIVLELPRAAKTSEDISRVQYYNNKIVIVQLLFIFKQFEKFTNAICLTLKENNYVDTAKGRSRL